MKNPKSVEELMADIRGIAKSASADNKALDMKASDLQGATTIENSSGGEDKKLTRSPETNDNVEKPDTRMPGDAPANGTVGELPTATQSGNAKEDAATSPTTDISKIAADLLADIQGINKASKAKPAVAKEADAAKPEPSVAKEAADAGLDDLALVKVAKAVLAVEGGIEFARHAVEVAEGVAAVDDLMKQASAEEQAMLEQADYEDYLEKFAAHQQAMIEETLDGLLKNASEKDRGQIGTLGNALGAAISRTEDPLEAEYLCKGAADAGAMMDEMGAEGGGEISEDPELGPEELLEVLQAAVDSGEIQPEVAEQVAALLLGGEGGGEGMPPEGGLSPEEEAMMAEAEKTASAVLA